MSYSRVIRPHEKIGNTPIHDKRGIVSKIFSRGDKSSGLMMESSGSTIRSYAPASGNTLLFVTEYNESIHKMFKKKVITNEKTEYQLNQDEVNLCDCIA